MRATINDIEVFLTDEQPPAFTLSGGSISDPSQIKGVKSTTIRVRATKESRRVLGTERMAEVPKAGRPVLRIGEGVGDLFKSPVIPVSHDRDTIECLAQAGNASWFERAKATKLRELDMGSSAAVTSALQAASWTNADGPLYWPVMDYGHIEGRAAAYNITTERLRPGVRAHAALTNAFESWGLTLTPKGTLADVWPKFVLPNHRKKIGIAASTLALESATYDVVSGSTVHAGSHFENLAFTATTDPGSNYIGPGYYRAPYAMSTRIAVSLRFTALFASPLLIRAQVYNNTTNTAVGTSPWITMVTGVSQYLDFDFGNIDMTATHDFGIRVFVSSGAGFTFTRNSGTVTFTPVDITYAAGVEVDVADLLPDWTVSELLTALSNIKCLAFNTKRTDVEVWYDDEFYRKPVPSSLPRDWTTRMDHTDPPTKVLDEFPVKLNFTWKQDTKDRDLVLLGQEGPEGYAHATLDYPNNYGKEKTIAIPFAPTAMGYAFDGGLFIPVSRKEGGTYQVDDFDRAPRILIADGLADGDWTHDSTSRTQYPKCYFAPNNATDTMIYHGNGDAYGDTRQGTAYDDWAFRLRRNSAPALECSLLVRDNEIQDFDHGLPTRIDDGGGALWYYVYDVKNYRFGQGLRTKCLLVPIPTMDVALRSVYNPATEFPEVTAPACPTYAVFNTVALGSGILTLEFIATPLAETTIGATYYRINGGLSVNIPVVLGGTHVIGPLPPGTVVTVTSINGLRPRCAAYEYTGTILP